MDRSEVPIQLHRGDLAPDLDLGDVVAVDTETMGLNPERDPLCLVQLFGSNGACHLVHFPPELRMAPYKAPNLTALLGNEAVLKIFHFGRFDIGVIYKYLGLLCGPVYCTKIASKLARTYTDRHGLKDLCREILEVDLSKEQQSSDWGRETLSSDQCRYAANDVLYLHELRRVLDQRLVREGRQQLAEACFRFLPHRAILDIAGWSEVDVLAH